MGYKYAWDKFGGFCKNFNVAPIDCSPNIVVKYIRKLVGDGANYQTINFQKSAISKFHVGFQGLSVGMHPLVKQALKAAFRLKPPLPKYQITFDIEILFKYLKSLPPNECLSFKQLSYKTLILTIYATLSRVSSVARLGPTLDVYRDHVVLFLCHLEKQSRPGNVRGFLTIPKFTEDPQLCPAEALQEYSAKVSGHKLPLCLILLFPG